MATYRRNLPHHVTLEQLQHHDVLGGLIHEYEVAA